MGCQWFFIALGAQRKTILQMVLNQGLTLALAGAAVGLVGALIVSHLMAGLLYGVSPISPPAALSGSTPSLLCARHEHRGGHGQLLLEFVVASPGIIKG
jgi:ABC-type antimicrobial peptide transport system permease subunit